MRIPAAVMRIYIPSALRTCIRSIRRMDKAVRLGFSTLTVALLLVQPMPLASAQGPIALPGMTLGAFFNGLSAVITQLEASARALLEQGNNAAAQQQMLLAGILRGTIEQGKSAYAESLELTFSEVGVAEQNAAQDILFAIDRIGNIEKSTAEDVQNAIYRAQGSANQLLNKVPLLTKTPVFYGIKVRDLTINPGDHPSDIELLGFMFTDSRIGTKVPLVTVGGLKIPAQHISI